MIQQQQQVGQGQIYRPSCEKCASVEAMNTQLREQLDKQEETIYNLLDDPGFRDDLEHEGSLAASFNAQEAPADFDENDEGESQTGEVPKVRDIKA